MKFFKITLLIFLFSTLFYSCKKRGCADPEALNYESKATKDDHSCYYFWIGQKYQGGRIFYIDQTGKHGLIVSELDLPSTQWGCSSSTLNGADATIVGGGLQNTLDIVSGCSENTAASLCNNLDTLGYNDWYLPSIEEMKGCYETLGKIGQANLVGGYYWSSSENDAETAWLVMFANGSPVTLSKAGGYNVRAIRSF